MKPYKDIQALPAADRHRLLHEKVNPGLPENDDLAVHLFVCNHWDQGWLYSYFILLETIFNDNAGHPPQPPDAVPDESPSLFALADYQPGDFATAALATVLGHEAWLNSDRGRKAVAKIEARLAKKRGQNPAAPAENPAGDFSADANS